MPVKPSTVDPKRTFNPWKNKNICGSFKTMKASEFKELGLTVDDLLASQTMFESFLCQGNPVLSSGHKNGRCGRHGAYAGPKAVGSAGGKYSKYFNALNPEILDGHVGRKANNSLDSELSILSTLINEKSAGIKETASAADIELFKICEAIEKAYEKMDFTKLRDLLGKMKNLCEEGLSVQKEKGSLVKDIETYSKVYQVSLKQRQMEGDFIPLEIHVAQMVQIVQICAPVIINDIERAKINEKLQGLIIGSRKQSSPPLFTTESEDVGINDSDEE